MIGSGGNSCQGGPPDGKPRLVVVGGGFAGLHAVKHLACDALDVTVIDRSNHHLFQPLLYQVATGGLSSANITAPLRSVFSGRRGVKVRLGEVTGFDLEKRLVLLRDGAVPYDTLVLAAGTESNYFGHDEWKEEAIGLKTIEEADEIRRRILLAFEQAEWEPDEARRRMLLTFVVVGGGPTGVEVAGAIGEISRVALRRDFRNIDTAEARIILLDGNDRVLLAFPEGLAAKAAAGLARLGVTVRTGCVVKGIEPNRATIAAPDGESTIEASTIIWAAGMRGSPLGKALATAAGLAIDSMGRVPVQGDCTVAGHPEIFVVGDLARFEVGSGRPLPALAPVAIQQGHYVAQVIRSRLCGRRTRPFRYRDGGIMATVGRSMAVVDLGFLRLSGLFAWLTWLFVHIMYLVEFENRILVLVQWLWNYFTRNRSARLLGSCEGARCSLPRGTGSRRGETTGAP
jgi:NADH:ubiquinone reductase (H+-translocating)